MSISSFYHVKPRATILLSVSVMCLKVYFNIFRETKIETLLQLAFLEVTYFNLTK